ncbi:condensation domain-containing protein, partial [Francisella sp. SYW-9]|uniref:condensation domain-containing protein n=1 Tax=Francisella sp. SYW-9 TaxID=2610888 RepID=UPI00123CA618
SFNYLGQFDSQEGLWQLASQSSGIPVHSDNHDHNVININGIVIEGELRFNVVTQLGKDTTDKLSQSFQANLIRVQEHTQQLVEEGKEYYTLSDFYKVKSEADLTLLPINCNDSDIYKPFEMTDIQKAYLLGRQSQFEIGNVTNHIYSEYVYSDKLNVERLNFAINNIIVSFLEMRTVFDEQRLTQKYLKIENIDYYNVSVIEYDSNYNSEILNQIRSKKSHKVYDVGIYPLFDFFISRFKDKDVLHISIDLILLDAQSRVKLMEYINLIYQDQSYKLPNYEICFKDYQDYVSNLKNSLWYKKDKLYWDKKVTTLPLRPDLSLNVDPTTVENPKFNINERYIDKQIWSRFKDKCANNAISPSAALLSLYGYIISRYSQSSDFLITLTVFNRINIHKEVNDIWGDFTSTNLFGYQDKYINIYQKFKNIHDDLWSDLDHKLYTGLEVQRDLTRIHKLNPYQAASPVVFTCAVGGDDESQQEEFLSTNEIIEDRYFSGQTSQAWLDLQAIERNGEFYSAWMYVEQLFDKELVDSFNKKYCSLIEYIAEADWDDD